MNRLYPLKFNPIFKEKIWGGQKLRTILNKDFGNLSNCGESWEISGVKGNESVVSEGKLKDKSLLQLLEEFGPALTGNKVYEQYQNEFPLLIKFLDANEDLSIQVHPDDTLAEKRHKCKGKTEMWYIFQADEGAKLIAGFNRKLDKESYLKHFREGTLMEILNQESVKAGDVFFIPAGRVHTIGKGICIAEIQQTSDITYRIYDFDRVDDKGNKRELHVEEALDALDYNHYQEYKSKYTDDYNKPVNLVDCPFFYTNKLIINQSVQRNYNNTDSFIIYICFEGRFQIEWAGETVKVKMGETVLLPAEIKEVNLVPEPGAQILEVAADKIS